MSKDSTSPGAPPPDAKGEFKCDLCNKTLKSELELTNHKRDAHRKESSAKGAEGMVKGAE